MSNLSDEELGQKVNEEHAAWTAGEDARADERAEWLAAFKEFCCGFVPSNPNASARVIVIELERHLADLYY